MEELINGVMLSKYFYAFYYNSGCIVIYGLLHITASGSLFLGRNTGLYFQSDKIRKYYHLIMTILANICVITSTSLSAFQMKYIITVYEADYDHSVYYPANYIYIFGWQLIICLILLILSFYYFREYSSVRE